MLGNTYHQRASRCFQFDPIQQDSHASSLCLHRWYPCGDARAPRAATRRASGARQCARARRAWSTRGQTYRATYGGARVGFQGPPQAFHAAEEVRVQVPRQQSRHTRRTCRARIRGAVSSNAQQSGTARRRVGLQKEVRTGTLPQTSMSGAMRVQCR